MKSFPKYSEMREVDSSNKCSFGSSCMDPHRVEIASYCSEHVLHLGNLHKGADELRVRLRISPLTDTLKGLGRMVRQNGSFTGT